MSNIVGIAIAAHNSKKILDECLRALQRTTGINIIIVVYDDGSTDGTREMLADYYPHVRVIRGNGDSWWAGGTNLAVEICLNAGCDFVLLLNPDVILERHTILQLVSVARQHPNTIVGSVVVSHENPDVIWWAGSKWSSVARYLPFVWTSRYILKRGTPVSVLPSQPYETSEVHGRAVLVPRVVYETIGLYDSNLFPHYAADTDFSFRATRQGFRILIDPASRVRLYTRNTGMIHAESLGDAWRGYWNYLTKRKNGEAFRIWWRLTHRHLPPVSAVLSFLFIIALNFLRYWSKTIRSTLKLRRSF